MESLRKTNFEVDTYSDPRKERSYQAELLDSPHLRVLIVDDDTTWQKTLSIFLLHTGYEVLTAETGAQAIQMVEENEIQLIIMDICMDDMNGLQVSEAIRQWSDVPIIMVSAWSARDLPADSLEAGADHFIAKPLNFPLLEAYILALTRRINWSQEEKHVFPIIALNGVELNQVTEEVTVRGKIIKLTPIEFRLLQRLMLQPGVPVSNRVLVNHIWHRSLVGQAVPIHTNVWRLRCKIEENPDKPSLIMTNPKKGYSFNLEEYQ